MKRLVLCIMSAFLLLAIAPVQLNAAMATTAIPVAASKPAESTAANTLITRLDEINAADKSNMSSSEKRQLRKEVRSIKKQLKQLNGGVYLSVGAIIIILLVLILLL